MSDEKLQKIRTDQSSAEEMRKVNLKREILRISRR